MDKELDVKIKAMAARIKELREIEGISLAEMATLTGVSEQEYAACERGERDLNFAFQKPTFSRIICGRNFRPQKNP